MDSINDYILSALLIIMFLSISIIGIVRFIKNKKRSNYFFKVVCTKIGSYERRTPLTDSFDETVYVYKYMINGEEKEYHINRDYGKQCELLYDSENGRIYNKKEEQGNLEFYLIFGFSIVAMTVCAIITRMYSD